MSNLQLNVELLKERLHRQHLTWSVVNVGHGATFGGDVTQVDLLGLNLNLEQKQINKRWGKSRQ